MVDCEISAQGTVFELVIVESTREMVVAMVSTLLQEEETEDGAVGSCLSSGKFRRTLQF